MPIVQIMLLKSLCLVALISAHCMCYSLYVLSLIENKINIIFHLFISYCKTYDLEKIYGILVPSIKKKKMIHQDSTIALIISFQSIGDDYHQISCFLQILQLLLAVEK